MVMEKYKNEKGEKSKAQIRREDVAERIDRAYQALKLGDCSVYYSSGWGISSSMMRSAPRLRVLLARSNNINKEQLEGLLKDCKKSQHHIARKICYDRLQQIESEEKGIK